MKLDKSFSNFHWLLSENFLMWFYRGQINFYINIKNNFRLPDKCNCYLFNMEDIQNKQRQSQTFPPQTYTLKVVSTAGRLLVEKGESKRNWSQTISWSTHFWGGGGGFTSQLPIRESFISTLLCFFGFCILCNFLLDSSHCECYLLGTKYFNILINILEVCSEI